MPAAATGIGNSLSLSLTRRHSPHSFFISAAAAAAAAPFLSCHRPCRHTPRRRQRRRRRPPAHLASLLTFFLFTFLRRQLPATAPPARLFHRYFPFLALALLQALFAAAFALLCCFHFAPDQGHRGPSSAASSSSSAQAVQAGYFAAIIIYLLCRCAACCFRLRTIAFICCWSFPAGHSTIARRAPAAALCFSGFSAGRHLLSAISQAPPLIIIQYYFFLVPGVAAAHPIFNRRSNNNNRTHSIKLIIYFYFFFYLYLRHQIRSTSWAGQFWLASLAFHFPFISTTTFFFNFSIFIAVNNNNCWQSRRQPAIYCIALPLASSSAVQYTSCRARRRRFRSFHYHSLFRLTYFSELGYR